MLPRLRLLRSHISIPSRAGERHTKRLMAAFTLPDSSPSCTVSLPPQLSQEQLLSFRPFKNWISALQKTLALQDQPDHTFHASPYKLRSIEVQAVDFFSSTKIGFVKLKAEVTNDKGEWLPGAVFLRGGSVAMLLILQPDDVPANSEDEKHVILAIQPRIAAASLAFAELPAGMIDDSGTFAGAAAKEITEETGLSIPEEELVDMTSLASLPPNQAGEGLQAGIYPSPGACDEFIPVFLNQKRVPRDQLKEWQGKLTGLRDEGEKITLKLVPLKDLWKEGARDGKTLAAWALYEGLKREGKV